MRRFDTFFDMSCYFHHPKERIVLTEEEARWYRDVVFKHPEAELKNLHYGKGKILILPDRDLQSPHTSTIACSLCPIMM